MKRFMMPLAAVVTAAAGAASLATAASARSTAKPTVLATPTLQGPTAHPFVGDKLSTTNGAWTENPTGYTYQWQRCDATGDRQNCVAITGGTTQSYTISKDDANHTLNAVVTATNADGSTSSDTKATAVVAPAAAPVDKTPPAITGSPTVGSTLTASTGTWVGAVSFAFVWQSCDGNGNNCADIAGATGRTYGARTADVGRELRVRVRASNKFGATNVASSFTPVVTAETSTTVVTTTVAGPQPPVLKFRSLRRVGTRLYARFTVCHDGGGRIGITERDNKARTLSYARHFVVHPYGCATYQRSWKIIARFRAHAGRLVVTLRATDTSGRLSHLVSRSVAVR